MEPELITRIDLLLVAAGALVAGAVLGMVGMAILAAGGRADEHTSRELEQYRVRKDWDPDKKYERPEVAQ